MENFDQILDSPAAGNRQLQYAGFWIRVGAYLIDALILIIPNVIFTFVLPQVISSVASIAVGIAYFGYLESSEKQATFGKQAVGIKVGGINGEQISMGNAIGRYFAKILSGLILLIGFIMVAFDSKNQGLHDKLANTYVFYDRS
jgi:uncharacterized RDD family membrane protein YckC